MIRKILVAPDSFKGTMTSMEVCQYVAESILQHLPQAEILKVPIADGGEGTVDAYLAGAGGERISVTVTGPMRESVSAQYGIMPDGTAIIEMAAASGLPLVQGDLKPMQATTFGTGEIIADALRRGCRSIILGIGGSATTDGGIGALSALGARFLDAQGQEVSLDGAGMGRIASIDDRALMKEAKEAQITIACDVKNPLAGKNGAAYIYAPQKGANARQILELDRNLLHYNEIMRSHTGVDLRDNAGMGAAGGLALSLVGLLGARMRAGIDLILDEIKFDEKLQGADLVITGEGKIDGQSKQGKVPVGIAQRAKQAGIPVVALVGDVGAGYETLREEGITAIFSTNKAAVSYEFAKKTCVEDLKFLVDALFAFYVGVHQPSEADFSAYEDQKKE